MPLWIAFNRQACHVTPGKVDGEEQCIRQAVAGRFVLNERTLCHAATEAIMFGLWGSFRGWLE